MSKSRVILLPQGWPRSRQQEICREQLHYLGGDLQRVIELGASNEDRFLRHAKRLPVIREAREPALVLLTRTNPVALSIFHLRRVFEEALPALRVALWCVFVDLDADPFFFNSAPLSPAFSDRPEDAPLLRSPEGAHFVVLSAAVDGPAEILPHRAYDAHRANQAQSTGTPGPDL